MVNGISNTWHALRKADPKLRAGRTEVVFIDRGVDDWAVLADGAALGVEVVLLRDDTDALGQIADWSSGHGHVDAVHIVSHGDDGIVRLGPIQLDAAALLKYRGELARLGHALAPRGDILLYGCNVGRGVAGAAFAAALSKATGANVAASTTPVGAARLGGNWDLAHRSGSVTTEPLFDEATRERFPHVLATLTVDPLATPTATTFNTIQAAVDAASAGDTVSIVAGTYREQVRVTKGLVLDAASGAGTVTLEAPDTASLSVSPQQSINNRNRIPILDLVTATPGVGTITVRNLTIDGRFQAPTASNGLTLIGIGAYDTNTVIDRVEVKGIAEPTGAGGVYDGDSVNFGIVAEGSSVGTPVTLTITNSTIGTFQKTGIVAWGPGLTVDIRDNTINAVGNLGTSVQNGMQIGSGAPRNGTVGTISGNTINSIGSNNPVYNATGILFVSSGAVEAFNNTINTTGTASWQGAYGFSLMQVSENLNIHDNTLNNQFIGIIVESNGSVANHEFSNNNFNKTYYAVFDNQDVDHLYLPVEDGGTAANATTTTVNSGSSVDNGLGYLSYYLFAGNDAFTDTGLAPSIFYGGSGNDALTAGGGNDTLSGGTGTDTLSGGGGNDIFAYASTGDGVDVIADFGVGDLIRVTGRASTSGTVTVGDGSSVAVNSIQISTSGGVTTLYVDTEGDSDAAELEISLTGTYGVGNFVLTGTDIAFDPSPTLSSSNPADNSVGVGISQNLVLTFSETVQASTGALTLKRVSNDVTVETFAATDARVTVSSSQVTINPNSSFDYSTAYYLEIASGAFVDAAGNSFSGLTGNAAYNFTTESAPQQQQQDDSPAPTTTKTQTVDGVVVQETTQVKSDGTVTQTLAIPIVTANRLEENAKTTDADIPLVKDSAGQSVLEATLPVGVGLDVETTTTSTTSQTGTGLEGLIRAIQNRTENQPDDKSKMTSVGQVFLNELPKNVDLTVRTIIPKVADMTAPPAAPIVITGTRSVPASGGGVSPSGQQQAIVIDVRNLPKGTVIQLQNVEFAAIVGDIRVTGGEGSQVVVGDSGSQYIVLGEDDDTLRGGGGNDFVGSEGGDDQLWGDEGYDTVTGGIGNDVLYGNQQDDLLYGNQGTDTLFGGQDTDTLFGGQDGDVLYGNRADDVLYGQLGDDTLFGGQSNDVLWGGQGNDVLAGNLGADTLYGGLGADVFRIGAVEEGGDVIADFEAGVDKLLLFSPNFPGVSGGTLPAQHFALDSPTTTNAAFVFNTTTKTLAFDADGTGAGAAVTLATLNVRTLSASDILVIGNGG